MIYTSTSDEELLLEIKQGNTLSLDLYLNRYQASVYTFLSYLVDDEEELSTILEQSFLSLLGQTQESGERTLLRLLRACIDLRTDAPEAVILPNRALSETLRGEKGQEEDADLLHSLQRRIRRLPEEYRIAFVARDILGVTLAEGAELLNLTEVDFAAILRRARRMLRRGLHKALQQSVSTDHLPHAPHFPEHTVS